jgi:CubicO group peptidase (beta-lactamase class C family)
MAAGSTWHRALAQSAGPFVGTWSILIEPGGIPDRLKLVIGADGKVIVILVDAANEAVVPGTVRISGKRIFLDKKDVATSFTGELTDPNTIKGAYTSYGKTLQVTFVRGDLYPVDMSGAALIAAVEGPLTLDKLHRLRLAAELPAIGAAWAVRGQPRHILVDGVRATVSPDPVRAGDLWQLGSITKCFTATLAARLVEAGWIGWHDTVGATLGPRISGLQPVYRDASVLHLLSHTAGLPRDLPPDQAAPFSRLPLSDPRRERLAYAQIALAQTPIAALGQVMSYSNIGYAVVGAMLEAATGKPWEALMTAHVFAPLRLRRFAFDAHGGLRSDMPSGHVYDRFHKLQPADVAYGLPAAEGPAGSICLDLASLLGFLEAHRDHRRPFLSEASWRKLHRPPFPKAGGGYTLGWQIFPDGTIGHTGSIGSWLAAVAIDGEGGSAFAAAANALTAHASAAIDRAHRLALAAA